MSNRFEVVKGTNENDKTVAERAILLPVLKLIHINQALIVAHTLRNVIGIRNLHFNIETSIGICIFNVNIKANTFAVGTSFNNFFALRKTNIFNRKVQNKLKEVNAVQTQISA